MGQTMACSLFSAMDPLREVQSLLDEAVSAYRNRGQSRTIATDQAAMALGLTPRRAKSLLYGETFKVSEEERRAVKMAYLKHLDDEAEHFAARLEAARARRRQMELDIV